MEVHVDAVLLAEAQEQVAGDPDLVGGPLRALAEDLELPLALGDLGVDALVVDAGLEAEVEVGVDDLAGDVADVLVADAGVVLALRRREPLAREAERHAVPVEEVLLLEAEPRVGIVRDRRAAVARVRRLVGQEHLAHDERAVGPGRVGEDGDRLQQAVGVAALPPGASSCRRSPTSGAPRGSGSSRTPSPSSCCGGSGRARSRRARCIRACTWSSAFGLLRPSEKEHKKRPEHSIKSPQASSPRPPAEAASSFHYGDRDDPPSNRTSHYGPCEKLRHSWTPSRGAQDGDRTSGGSGTGEGSGTGRSGTGE